MASRKFLNTNGLQLSYIDYGGTGEPLLALHGHFGCARMFSDLAGRLRPSWRVIALDQRGHGWSDKPADYSREAYINDLAGVIENLDLSPVVILGHSMGGVNAYQLAARRPELVRALIIEDIGTQTREPDAFLPDWPVRFDTLKQVMDYFASIGMEHPAYFLESLTEYPDGWGFQFRYEGVYESQKRMQGDWSADWCASKCPVLLLHGHKSWALKTEHAREMASQRPDTRLVEFPDSSHSIHDDEPEKFYTAVKSFIDQL